MTAARIIPEIGLVFGWSGIFTFFVFFVRKLAADRREDRQAERAARRQPQAPFVWPEAPEYMDPFTGNPFVKYVPAVRPGKQPCAQ